MKPFDRTYPVDMSFADGGVYTFRAGTCRQSIEAETFLAGLADIATAAALVDEAIAILAPRLVSAPYPLEDHEPMMLVQLIATMIAEQTISYGQKKSSSSPSPSATEISPVTAAAPAEPLPVSTSSAPVATAEAAPTAITSAGGPSTAAPAASSPTPPVTSSALPISGDAVACPTPAAP